MTKLELACSSQNHFAVSIQADVLKSLTSCADQTPSQQNSTLSWLTALGLQQHYTAFHRAGHGDVQSLMGLNGNHLIVIERGVPGGLPAGHKRAILLAAHHLTSAHSGAAAPNDASRVPSLDRSPQPETLHPGTGIGPEALAPQAPLPTDAARHAASRALDSSMSSYTSFTSSGSESDSTLDHNLSRSSTANPSTVTPARKPLQLEQSRLAATTVKPAPSQSQLQELYSQMEEDYKKLPDRPMHPRLSSQPPMSVNNVSSSAALPQPRMSGISATPGRGSSSNTPTAAPPSVPDSRAAVGGARHIQSGAGVAVNAAQLPQTTAVLPARVNRPTQQTSTSGRGPQVSAAHHRRTSGSAHTGAQPGQVEQRVSAAEAVRQIRKEKKVQPDEPFVQVFTNFHTIAKASCLQLC